MKNEKEIKKEEEGEEEDIKTSLIGRTLRPSQKERGNQAI